MSIEGERHVGPPMVPVIKNGRRTTVHPNRVEGYSLETAHRLVTRVRSTIATTGYQHRNMLGDDIRHLAEFARAAGEVIAACGTEINRLERKRSKLHNKAPAERFDSALAKLQIVRRRHMRMRSSIGATITRAQHAKRQWRDKGKGARNAAERGAQAGNLRRKTWGLKRG